MELILAISTSSFPFEVFLGNENDLLFNSKEDTSLAENKDIGFFVTKALAATQAKIQDIKHIILDIGPGGTSVIRTGVAFGNSLAYSLKIPTYPVSTLEILGMQVYAQQQIPVICTANSLKGQAYVGLFDKDKLVSLKYGLLETVVEEMTAEIPEFSVAGYHNEKIISLFPHKNIQDSGIKHKNAALLLEKKQLFLGRGLYFPHFANPITEQSIFVL